jgi:hypothetical protein
VPRSGRHFRRHVPEDGGESVEVEHGVVDRVLVDVDAVVVAVALDQALERFRLQAAQRPRRLLKSDASVQIPRTRTAIK